MGMSASQVRLLSLTSRLSDLEYQAQVISNEKLRLADQTSSASEAYQAALNKQVITVMSSDSNSYIDATAYNLTTYDAVSSTDKQRFLQDSAGRIIISESVAGAYDNSQNTDSTAYYLQNTIDNGNGSSGSTGYATVDDFLKAAIGYSTEAEATSGGYTYDKDLVNYYTNLYTGKEQFMNSLGYTSATSDVQSYLTEQAAENGNTYENDYSNDSAATTYYSNVYDQISKNGANVIQNSDMQDSDWLYEQLSSGNIYLSEWDSTGGTDGKGDWTQVSYSSGDSTLTTKTDDTDTAKAEADYEAVTAQIEVKDKRFDLQLKDIDTQHSAIQTELDSVKKVIDKNIEQTFKTFNA